MFIKVFLIVILCLISSVVNCWCISGWGYRYSNYNSGCVLPKHPINGKWWISGGSRLSPGQQVGNGNVLSISCKSQFKLIGSSVITCRNGKWSSEVGQCLELCPPLIDKPSIRYTCTTNGKPSDCALPTNGTVVTLQCKPYYENSEININPFRFCKNGVWNDVILPCTPVCGVKPEESKDNTTKPFYPWNVIMYKTVNDTKVAKCVGTLINENAILTAASCVSDETVEGNNISVAIHPLSTYVLAAGKSCEEFEDSRDPEAQYTEVKDIFIPDNYKGVAGKFSANIAVIISTSNFNMTRRIQPACVDWSNQYIEQYQYPNISGKIAGPILPLMFPNFTRTVDIDIPLIGEPECFRILTKSYNDINFKRPLPYHFIYSISDKYCSDFNNSQGLTDCIMDVGVGLITRNPYNKKYYVTGVFSGGTIDPTIEYFECADGAWMLYTKVHQYLKFILEKVNLYIPINREQYQATCGIKSVQAQTLIVDGHNVTKGDYPWQVAIYRVKNSTKSLICGGSLINPRLVLTAAHCLSDDTGKKYPTEDYILAVGKYYRNFSDSRDEDTAQFSTVKEIILPNEYQGNLQNYAGDIAIMITENAFDISKNVQPVCVDWDAKYEAQFLKPNIEGFVAGWGYTQEDQSPSEELKDLGVPYIDPAQCAKVLSSDFAIYLTNDKLCSGFLEEGKGVCNGDSGGGLVFKNKNDNRYYLAGIVSLSPQRPTGGCDSEQYALYTRVSKYIKNFISQKVRLYWN